MKIKWYGHSAFLFTASDGTRVITDPYVPGSFSGAIRYGPIRDEAAAVTVSHHHQDHDGTARLSGKPKVIEGNGRFTAGRFEITGVNTFHDARNGAERGRNTIYVFESEGVRVCHCGDLGHVLSPAQAAAIGRVDVLIVPVGGTFTVNAAEAHRVADILRPRVVIPMHYKTTKLGFDIAGVENFLAGQQDVKRAGKSEVEVEAGTLPAATEIWVLEHAL
jgi:L-ascorbate metabolism protein UlaG (beta-lactamase superfamily)